MRLVHLRFVLALLVAVLGLTTNANAASFDPECPTGDITIDGESSCEYSGEQMKVGGMIFCQVTCNSGAEWWLELAPE